MRDGYKLSSEQIYHPGRLETNVGCQNQKVTRSAGQANSHANFSRRKDMRDKSSLCPPVETAVGESVTVWHSFQTGK